MPVVVVESPAKARTIERYLGRDYTVLASYGHVSDLPARDGSVLPERDFEMVYETNARAAKPLKAIAGALAERDGLVLATDPDREGEAISWHVLNWLQTRGAFDGGAQRVVFHEVTRDAVRDAMARPRDIDMNLVNAQQARRALDYLVGFTLSPVLWRKLPGSRSAGRVQSVALRLVCSREAEIESFVSREYWTVEADFVSAGGAGLSARLVRLDGARLDKFALPDSDAARSAAARVRAGSFRVARVERKRVKRRPQPPFITSTLQQEASRKLGLTARRSMQIAQKLYEGVDIGGEAVGLITYMRTDSVNLAATALAGARELIGARFGGDYLPARPRSFRSSTRNAQEAHEAIRPTDFARAPEAMARILERDERRLYELIWKRAVASQMAEALIDQTGVDIATPDGDVVLRATGSVVAFDGFLRLYREDRDDPAEDDRDAEGRLPPVAEGEPLAGGEVRPERHETEPPPRYTEASLVKRLEELGIGRPSTYASIIGVLQDRDYVVLEKKRFAATARGRLVTAFLEAFFANYVEYGFTAGLEEDLDRISNGAVPWKQVLREFWKAFHAAVGDAEGLERARVLEAVGTRLADHVFPPDGDGKDPRRCPGCADGRLNLKLGKFGAFVGCSNYPDCRYTRRLVAGGGAESAENEGPRELGRDPRSGALVELRHGPYGPYVQRDEGGDRGKPSRVSLPPGLPAGELGLDTALRLLALPREVGPHPDDGRAILAGIGRYGPYLNHGKRFVSLPPGDDVLAIGLNRAATVIAENAARGGRREASTLRELGDHPDDGKPVSLRQGRYGPYVAHGRVFASLPKDVAPETATLDQALEWLARKAATKRKPARPKAAKKATKAQKKAPPRRSGA